MQPDHISIRVRLNATLRKYGGRWGGPEFELTVPAGATVAEVVARLGIPRVAAGVAAVNLQHVPWDHRLHPGDELLLLPPISGGCPGPSPARHRRSGRPNRRAAPRRRRERRATGGQGR